MQDSGCGADRSAITHRTFKSHRIISAVTAVLILAASVDAQTALAQQTSASPDPGLQEIVVTAGRREEVLSNVGVGITAVSGAELEARSAASLQDFVSQVPGLNLQSLGTPGTGVVAIRGISPQGAAATVATYVDNISIGWRGQWYTERLVRARHRSHRSGADRSAQGPAGHAVRRVVARWRDQIRHKTPSLTSTEISTSEELNDVRGGSPGTKMRASVATPIIENELALRSAATTTNGGVHRRRRDRWEECKPRL